MNKAVLFVGAALVGGLGVFGYQLVNPPKPGVIR